METYRERRRGWAKAHAEKVEKTHLRIGYTGAAITGIPTVVVTWFVDHNTMIIAVAGTFFALLGALLAYPVTKRINYFAEWRKAPECMDSELRETHRAEIDRQIDGNAAQIREIATVRDREWATLTKDHNDLMARLQLQVEQEQRAHEETKTELSAAKVIRAEFQRREKIVDEIKKGWADSQPSRLPVPWGAQRAGNPIAPDHYIDYMLDRSGHTWRCYEFRKMEKELTAQQM